MQQRHPLIVSHLSVDELAVALENGADHVVEEGVQRRFAVDVAVHDVGAVFEEDARDVVVFCAGHGDVEGGPVRVMLEGE